MRIELGKGFIALKRFLNGRKTVHRLRSCAADAVQHAHPRAVAAFRFGYLLKCRKLGGMLRYTLYEAHSAFITVGNKPCTGGNKKPERIYRTTVRVYTIGGGIHGIFGFLPDILEQRHEVGREGILAAFISHFDEKRLYCRGTFFKAHNIHVGICAAVDLIDKPGLGRKMYFPYKRIIAKATEEATELGSKRRVCCFLKLIYGMCAASCTNSSHVSADNASARFTSR